MASELDQSQRLPRQLHPDRFHPKPGSRRHFGQVWISDGGVAADGMKYGPPSRAVAWGHEGCPLLPRAVREYNWRVKLPLGLQTVLGRRLAVPELDSDVLRGLSDAAIWRPPPREFRDFLYSLTIPATQVAIPAGVPLAWIEELPITGRTRGAVRRAFRETGVADFLKLPMLAREFLGIREIGVGILNELTCVIESAELGSTNEDPTIDLEGVGLRREPSEPGDLAGPHDFCENQSKGVSALDGPIGEFARWAMAETDAQTFGEAISELLRAGAANEAWKPVASLRLTDLAAHPQHPYEVLDKWMEQLDPRGQAIYVARVASHPQSAVTLEELGVEFSVSRERIRQIETKLRHSLETLLISDEALPVRWRASTLRRALSVAAPVHTVEHLLTSPPGCNDHRGVLLGMAGPYDRDRDWLVLRSARPDEPTSVILGRVDEVGRIDREFATLQLAAWGLDASLHERWLARDSDVRLFNEQLIVWGASISDRLAFALADMGRPSTVDEMITHVQENRSRNSIHNALAEDSRVVKVSRTHWALASWGLTEYSGIAESMRKLILESGGAIDMDEAVHRMQKMFGVTENSTLAYCGAPMFVTEEKSLRLRTHHDGPYQYGPDLLRRTPGVFRLGAMRLGRLLKVDRNILRGSGTALTHAAGSILGIEVGSHLSLYDQQDDKVDITFPESSFMGPSIGSVRRIAERLSAKEGDYLTLILDRPEMAVSAILTDPICQSPGWEAIGRLTGVTAPVDSRGLAKALGCHTGEVRSVLRARGDDVVLGLLPSTESSNGLDDALAALEDHVDKVRWRQP